jgi:hypothetical protein
MDYLSITWILDTWELQSVNVVAAQSLSNLLILLYAITYILTKKGCYFAVFLFDESITNLSIVDNLSEPNYYLMVSFIYCLLYWNIERKNTRLKTIVACGIIVLFNAGMGLDAAVNSEVETIIYQAYIYVVVLLHLYLISTLFRWEFIGKSMERSARAFCYSIGVGDAFTFIWYNLIIIKKNQS